jgi:hypothetical protein
LKELLNPSKMAQVEPLNQDQQSMLKIFISGTNQLPKFKGERGEMWTSFETLFRLRFANSGLNHFPLAAGKSALLGCLEGKAARAHVLCGAGTAAYNDSPTMDAFIDQLKSLFQPAAESQLARLEFESLKQAVREPISNYHSHKMVLYAQAVPNAANHNFSYLRTHMLKGIYSNYVKNKVIEADIENPNQLLQVMVSASANAMEAYTLDTGLIPNTDGLASTSTFDTYDEDAMDISKVGPNDKCHNCDGKGHYARDCPKPKRGAQQRAQGSGNQPRKGCYFCDAPGHFTADCNKKKKWKEEQAKARAERLKMCGEEDGEYDDEDSNNEPVDGPIHLMGNEDFWEEAE